MIGIVEDKRAKYAALMREMADRIEQSDKQPEGAFVQIFFIGGEMARARTLENGFNLMYAAGSFNVMSVDLAHEILSKQEKLPS